MEWSEMVLDPKNTYRCQKCEKVLDPKTNHYYINDDGLFDWTEEELLAKFGVTQPWADFGLLCRDCLEAFDPNYQLRYVG